MAKREFGVERLFNLGSFKNLRVREFIELDDDQYSEEQIDAVRMLMLLNAYKVFGMNKTLLESMEIAQKDKGSPLDGIEIIEIAEVLIEKINSEMEVTDDGA